MTPEGIAALREAEKGARERLEEAKRAAGVDEKKQPEKLAPIVPPLSLVRAPVFESDASREARYREEQARAQAKAKELLARRAGDALPPAFRWAELGAPLLAERVRNPPALPAAATLRADERAVFTGASGAGKTSLAAAASRHAAVEAGLELRFESAFMLSTARVKHPLGEGDPEIITQAERAGLLVIDELGSEEPRYREVLKEVIFARHWHSRATWVTTWMKLEDLAVAYGDGILRRIFQEATVIDCEGKS